MAFPKKGLRKITVDRIKYGYNVTGNDGWISFSIGLLEENGEILTGAFSYHHNSVTNFEKNGKIRYWTGHQRIKITPNTIRQVIEYGLKNGWNPRKNKGQLQLGNIDDKIELNLKEETKFPELYPNQVAINFVKLETGRVLDVNMELYSGEGEIYHVFDSIEDAQEFARNKIKEDSEIECWFMSEKNKAIGYINSIEEKEFK